MADYPVDNLPSFNRKEEFMKNTSPSREKFACNLKTLRMIKEESIYKVAKSTGISYSYLSNLETMKEIKNPSFEIMDKIAKYYNIEIYELFI